MGFFIATNMNSIPRELKDYIRNRKTDFIAKTSKKRSVSNAITALLFSLVFITVLGVMIYKFVNPILEKELLDSNKITEFENWKTLILPAICFGIFIMVGLLQLIKSVRLFFDKGVFFVGTEEELIIFRNANIYTKKWNEFSGKTIVKAKHNTGDLILELKSPNGTNHNIDEDILEEKSDQGFENKTITMVGIRNAMNIEKLCAYRMEEG